VSEWWQLAAHILRLSSEEEGADGAAIFLPLLKVLLPRRKMKKKNMCTF
jgi:hypothetical protein